MTFALSAVTSLEVLNALADVNNFDKRLSLTCGIHLPINNSRVNLFFSGTRLSCNCFPRNASKLNIVILQLDVGTNQIVHFQSLTFNYFYRANSSFFFFHVTPDTGVCTINVVVFRNNVAASFIFQNENRVTSIFLNSKKILVVSDFFRSKLIYTFCNINVKCVHAILIFFWLDVSMCSTQAWCIWSIA